MAIIGNFPKDIVIEYDELRIITEGGLFIAFYRGGVEQFRESIMDAEEDKPVRFMTVGSITLRAV